MDPQKLNATDANAQVFTLSDAASILGCTLSASPEDCLSALSAIARDSRLVKPGSLFVCIRGSQFDSHRFVAEAIANGAVAIVANNTGFERAEVDAPTGVPVLYVGDTRVALPKLACEFHRNPSYSMVMIGVTGTNGKTTTTRMIAAIYRAAGYRVGTIGTLGSELDGVPIESDHTTPEADELQALLAEMRSRGAEVVIMEVSSHALSQHRTEGIAFSGAVFTNLSLDHLDYHHTMEEYFAAKAILFSEYPILYPRPNRSAFIASIYVSQWEGRDLVTLARGDIITFSTDDTPAVLHAEDIVTSSTVVSFTAVYDSGVQKFQFPVMLPMGGAFQVNNALGAIAACLRLGVSQENIASGLANMPGVPGRFESVPTGDPGLSLIVDYAHTSDGLDNLLHSAQKLNPARIITVFGCGGNRDRSKRPKMGRLAATLSDIAIVTSDNPRKEDPEFIISEILVGMDAASDSEIKAEIFVEQDRRSAISLAINMAHPGDLVLITGKGHETYQLVGDAVLDFDDRQVAAELLAVRSAKIVGNCK